MKRYTIKNLPPSTQNETEDIRLTFTKSRSTFLWCAFKDLLLNETLAMRIIIVILVIGAIGLVALAYPEKSIVCLIALLIYYGRYIWAINKVYSMYKEGDTFPMLTFYGPQNTMSVGGGKVCPFGVSNLGRSGTYLLLPRLLGCRNEQEIRVWPIVYVDKRHGKSAANSFANVAECLGC